MLRTAFILIVTVMLGGLLALSLINANLSPSAEQQSNQRQRISALPNHMGKSITARFRGLPTAQQRAIRDNLRRLLLPVKDWLDGISQAQPQILCLGEEHEQSTRRFMAEKIFPRLQLDVLMLEATPVQLETINQSIQSGESFVALEGANIRPVIEAAEGENPGLVITGIEETGLQRRQRLKRSNKGFRDDTLAVNFWNRYRPGKHHALIFGALHCGNAENWLFAQLRQGAPETLRPQFLNIRVFGEYQNESLQAMIYFLNAIGITRDDFVIPDTEQLHPVFKRWFALLEPTLREYKTLVVYRTADYLEGS